MDNLDNNELGKLVEQHEDEEGDEDIVNNATELASQNSQLFS